MDLDLKPLESYIYRELKIDLSAYKSNQMNRRLNNLIARNGASTTKEYIEMLEKKPEMKKKLADFITINVSEFFRNKELFVDLENKLKEILVSNDNKKLKIWSAACSNGAEPYSVAIILDKLTPKIRHEILATDIDSTILETARQGIYNSTDVKNVDKDILKRHFSIYDDGKYILNEDIRNRVRFKKHDLILDDYEKSFDLILCRNVVIYFTQEAKDKIYSKFSESLLPGGLLFVGATESIYDYKKYDFGKASTFIYQKNK